MMGKETDGNLAVVAAEMNECVAAVACRVALVMMAGCMACRGSRSTKRAQKTKNRTGFWFVDLGHLRAKKKTLQ